MCNSSNLSDGELVLLASLRGSAGFLCAIITAVFLAAIAISSDKSRPTQRLLTYLTFASLLALLASTMQAESAGCSTPWHHIFCEVVGFVSQFSSWILLLVALWLSAVVSFCHWCPNNRVVLTAKRDAIVWGIVASLSFLFSAIPLATRGYGLKGAWCWIQGSRVVEQWVLWYGWMVGGVVTSVIMLVMALGCSERRLSMYYESSRGINNTKHQVSRAVANRIKILTACIALYLLVIALSLALAHIPQVRDTAGFLVATAILEPLGVIAIPVIFASSLYDLKPRLPAILRNKSHPIPAPPLDSGSESDCAKEVSKNKGLSGKKKYKDYSEEITSSLLMTSSVNSGNSDMI